MINDIIGIVIVAFALIGAVCTFMYIVDFFVERSERRDESAVLVQRVKTQERDINIIKSRIQGLNIVVEHCRDEIIKMNKKIK